MIIFRRPTDTADRSFYTYISKDRESNDRIQVELIPHGRKTVEKLMDGTQNRREVARVKKVTVLRMTH